jgi:hypothetical protein
MNLTAEEMNDEFEKEARRKSTDIGADASSDGKGANGGSGAMDFRISGKA